MATQNKGWACIHRQLTDSDFWLGEEFTRGQAWVDIVVNANYSDGSFWVRGIEVKVKRGQLGWSELTMAKRWKWSRGKVRRFLKWLEINKKIVQHTVQQITSIITLVNYDNYQQTVQQNGQQVVQQTDNRRYTNNKDNKDKKIITSNNDTYGNELVNLVLDSFKKLYGFNPTDKKPRWVGATFVKQVKTLIKEIGKEPTENNCKIIIKGFFGWVSNQDWHENVQSLDTLRRKITIYHSVMESNAKE